MNIKSKVLKDRKQNICTFTAICKKCGYTDNIDLGGNDGLIIAQMPCPKCDVIIPQVVVTQTSTAPVEVEIKEVKIETREPIKFDKPKKKKQKNFKMRYK